MREKYPSEAAERFQVRMPEGLRDRLRDAASAEGRSMNTEIVLRLQSSFEDFTSTVEMNAAADQIAERSELLAEQIRQGRREDASIETILEFIAMLATDEEVPQPFRLKLSNLLARRSGKGG